MRLTRFVVDDLFGLFDHEISFNRDERVTIIHAPNGYGKTVILKMIAGFFGGSLLIFRQTEFSLVQFDFSDGSTLFIRQKTGQQELFEPKSTGHVAYTITYEKAGVAETWDPFDPNSLGTERSIPPSAVDRYIPHLVRVGPRQWKDSRRGETLDYQEVVSRYWDSLPGGMRRSGPQPEWLESLRSSIHCQLIETQRLVTFVKGEGSAESMRPAVRSYPTDLAHNISRVLAASATLSQALDSTFPNRILNRMHDQNEPPSEDDLRRDLFLLERMRMRLTKAGLLDQSDDAAITSGDRFDVSTRKILAEYVEDTRKKLRVYDDLLARLELFEELINDRFQFKRMYIKRNEGFVFTDYRDRTLSAEALSSGEQHELVLIFDLLFKSRQNTLILIDEPEISLHIAWQKRFMSDIRRIIELSGVDVVISTHSPQLIGGNIDLTVQLRAPRDADHDF